LEGVRIEVLAAQRIVDEGRGGAHARIGGAGARAQRHAADDLVDAAVAVVVERVAALGRRADAAGASAPRREFVADTLLVAVGAGAEAASPGRTEEAALHGAHLARAPFVDEAVAVVVELVAEADLLLLHGDEAARRHERRRGAERFDEAALPRVEVVAA